MNRRIIQFVLFLIFLVPALAQAATYTWTGNSNGAWNTAGNWSPSGPPPPGSDLVFPSGASSTTMSNNIAANTAFNSITFSNVTGTTNYVINGNAFDLQGGGITSNDPGATNTINVGIQLATNSSLTATNSNDTLYISGVISDGGSGYSVTTSGAGTVQLAGGNTFSGGLTVLSGTAQGENTDAFGGSGTGTVTLGNSAGSSNATLYAASTLTFPNPIVLASNTTGTLSFEDGGNAYLTFSGGVTGTNNLTLNNAGPSTLVLSTGSVNNMGTVTNSSTNGPVLISAVIGSNVSSVIQNSSTSLMTLSAANTFAGSGLIVDAGAVDGTTNTTAFGEGNITIGNSAGGSSNATVEAGSTSLTFANPIVMAPNTTGTLTLEAVAYGEVFTGGVTGTNSLVLASSGDDLLTLSTQPVNNAGTITNTGNVIISSVIGTSVTGVIQNGSSYPLVLSGANTFTGGLTILNGTVEGETSTSVFGGSGNGTVTLGNSAGGSSNAILETNTSLTFANPIVLAPNTNGTLEVEVSGYNNPIFTGGVTGTNNFTINNANANVLTFSSGSINNIGTVTNASTSSGSVAVSSVIGSNVTGVYENSTNSLLILSAANTFGGLTVDAGIVEGETNATAFGGGNITIGNSAGGSSNATLDNVSTGLSYANPIVLASSTTGTLTIENGGSYATTFTGGITGTNNLVINSVANGAGDTITFSSGSINNTGTVSNNSTGGNTQVIVSSVIGANVTGVIQNTSSSAPLILSAANTFSGGLTVLKGTIEGETNAGAFGGSGIGSIILGNSAGGNGAATVASLDSTTFANPIVLASTTTGTLTIQNGISSSASNFSGGVTGTNNLTINSLGNAGGAIMTLSSGAINNSGTVTNTSTGANTNVTISAAVGPNVTGIYQSDTHSTAFNITGGLSVNSSGTTLQCTNPGVFTLSGGITGTGNLILNNNSTTASGITISTTSLNNTGTVTNSGTSTGSVAISAVIGPNVTSVIQNGASPMTLSGANTYTGTTAITAGTLSAGTIVVAAGSSNLGNATSAVTISGGGDLSYTGASASYTRGFTINSGVGEVDNTANNTLTIATGGVVTSSGATFKVGGTKNTTVSAAITGAGGVTMGGTGTLVLSSTSNTYSGATTVASGTLQTQAANTLGGSTSTSALTMTGGTLDMDGNAQAVGSITGTGTSITSTASGTFSLTTGNDNTSTSYSGTILVGSSTAFSLTKVGTGTQTLTGTNTYTGGTNINGGILNFTTGGISTSGNVTFGGGTLQYGTSTTTDISSRLKNSTTGSISIDNVNNNVTFGSAIDTSNTDGMVVNCSGTGTLTLSGTNTFTGGLTIDSGTVESLNDTEAFGGSGSGTVTLGNSAGGSNNATLEGDGTYANPIVLAPNTTGTLTIANPTSGSFIFTAGVTGTNSFTIDNSGNHAIDFSTNPVNNSGTVTNVSTSGSVDISSVIGTNVTGVIENSSQTLELDGANTFTSGLTIDYGTVDGTVTNAFGGSGSGTVYLGNSAGGSSYATMYGGDTSGATFANPIVLASNTTGTLTIENASNATTILTGGVTGANNLTIDDQDNGSNHAITISTGSINNTGTVTNASTGSGTTTINSVIGSNVIGLIQDGTTTLKLTGANTYTGYTEVESSTLQTGAANVLGGSSSTVPLQMNGGTLDMDGHSEAVGSLTGTGSTITSTASGTMTLTTGNDNTSTSYSGTITVGSATSFALNKVGNGTLSLSGADTYNGGTTFTGGILDFTGTALGSSGTLTFGGGTLQYGPSTTTDLSSRFAAPSSSPITIDTVNNNVTFATAITSTNAVVLNSSGTGTLTLNATNTFTGGLTIDSGTVETTNNADAFGGSGTGTVTLGNSAGGSSNATLEDASGQTHANPIVLASTTTGTLTIDSIIYGCTFSGGVTGTNSLTLDDASPYALTLSTGSVNNTGTVTNSGSGSGATTVSAVIGTNVTGVIQNSSTSMLLLSGPNTFTSGLTILSGTAEGQTSTSALGGSGTGTVILGNSSGGGNSATVESGNVASLANPIVLASTTTGTLTIEGSLFTSTFTGGVTGTNNLTIDNSGNNGTTLSTQSINNIGTVTNSGTGNGNTTISSVIGTNVTGVYQKSSTSILILSNANTFTGGLTIDAGTVQGETSTSALGGSSGTGTVYLGNSAVPGANATLQDIGVTLANPIVLASNTTGTLMLLNQTGGSVFTGGVTGTNNLTLDSGNGNGWTISSGSINNVGTVTNASTSGGKITISSVIGPNVTGVIESPSGTAVMALSGANTYTGYTEVEAGTLQTGAANVLGGASSTAQLQMNGGTLDMDGNSQAVGSITGTGSTITSTAAGTMTLTTGNDNTSTTYSGTITIGTATNMILTKVGTGTLTLSGTNTYNDGTNINGGILNFATNALGSAGNITFGGGTLQYGASTTTDLSSRFKNSTTGPISIDNVNNNLTYASAIDTSNTDGMVFNSSGTGTLTLNATNTFTGGLTIDSGEVISDTTSSLGGSGTGTVTLGNSAGGSSNAELYGGGTSLSFANPIVLASNTTGTLSIGSLKI